MASSASVNNIASTGVPGLDHVLISGLPRNRLYLIEGEPGAGKTTLGLQFLLAGRDAGERVMYINLSETNEELRLVAASHGWSLDGMDQFELSALEQQLKMESQNTRFHPNEIELNETTNTILAEVDRVKPTRVVFDSLSELRLMAQSPLRYRRQLLALKQFFSGRGCTVMLLDDRASNQGDQQVKTLAHGVISLEKFTPNYGAERRRLHINKLRGVAFRGGMHDFNIERWRASRVSAHCRARDAPVDLARSGGQRRCRAGSITRRRAGPRHEYAAHGGGRVGANPRCHACMHWRHASAASTRRCFSLTNRITRSRCGPSRWGWRRRSTWKTAC